MQPLPLLQLSLQLEAYSQRLGLGPAAATAEPLRILMPSGYVRLSAGAAWLVCDCAPVGPDHQPGHAHADTLSFELSLGTRRVFVNSGTSTYQPGPERQRQRGTAAHNTVVVDGGDSSEVWSGFRVARRARARLQLAHAEAEGVSIEASHDGYERLAGCNIHTRLWQLTGRSLCVRDSVSGRFDNAEARFHLHPAVQPELRSTNEVLLKCERGLIARMSFAAADAVDVVASTWHPEFGLTIASSCVRARFGSAPLRTRIEWAPEACES